VSNRWWQLAYIVLVLALIAVIVLSARACGLR
jgi:hypothetical protein